MRTIHSLTYTNVALTALILLLAALVLQPYLQPTQAHAVELYDDINRNAQQSQKLAEMNPNAANAAATLELAAAARDIAAAIRESAGAQKDIGRSIGRLLDTQ